MSNEKLLELCDKKIKLTKEIEEYDDEIVQKVRELILVEKELQKYVLTKDEVEII
ncbi:MAG: hypothetical protein J6T15_03630 [Bacilli bacterium]|nr:hypothetical protein [Bacilli bacterium]